MTLVTATTGSRAEGRLAIALACSEKHVTALGQVACELVRALPKSESPVVVRAARVISSVPLARAEQVSEKLSLLVAAELGPRARPSRRRDAPNREATRTNAGVEVIELRATLGQSHLVATAELLNEPRRRFWERFGADPPRAALRANATRPIDAELRSFLPSIPLLLTRVERASPPDESSLALACSDADGGLEILSVGRRKIQIGKIEKGHFRPTKSLDWNQLSEVSAHPLREPIGSAWTPAPGTFDVGLSDRMQAVRVDRTLSVLLRFPGQLPWPGGGCTRFKSTGLDASRAPCTPDLAPAYAGVGAIDAVAGARLPRQNGASFEVFVRRRLDAGGVLELDGREYELGESVGAQIAVADLNADGRAELVASANTLDPSADRLRVRTLLADGKWEQGFDVPIPGGVRALCTCPSRETGIAKIVAASPDALWILQ